MDPLFCTQILKFKGDKKLVCEDTLVREIKFDIFVNGKKVGAVMLTPVDEKALAVGYLMSEGIIREVSDIKDIKIRSDEMAVDIEAKIDEASLKNFNSQSVIISGCGRSSTANFDPSFIKAKTIINPIKFKRELILTHMKKFYTQCELYEKTGCVHTAKIFISEDECYIGEDIAQHNTIDKATGKARLNGADLKKSFLMVSGRLSSEMVAKAVMHQIPLIVSRTAPTSLGVMIARKFNLSLCGFAREDKINIYSGEQRIG